jgi:hypothetical protein
MKKIILLFIATSSLFACNESSTQQETKQESNTSNVQLAKLEMLKSYVGSFEAEKIRENAKSPTYANKINLSVTSLKDGKISGYSLIAGTQQTFEGTYAVKAGQFEVQAKEPGTDKHDGRFEFTLDTIGKKASGKWYCFDTMIDVPVRAFVLEEKTFAYDANASLPEDLVGMPFYDPKFQDEMGGVGEMVTKDILKVNPSSTELKKSQVENMFKGDLEVLRNSIYARHGYSFRNRKMRYIFDNYTEWYMPVSLNVEKELTEIEKKNIDLLKRYENHAAKYYDEFGR